ncbi:hypothetical protein PHLH5_42170 [Pseudomonas sp. Cab53]|uniref:Uncharacterized protein n=1 Tax=Pseudomonas fluorescens TaxID=294 RepID=A0A0D0NL22_PSEFL|nr:hypothetical protein RL74_08385 [Pseudomonas fluorescens]BBP66676.1 hypothetical protein PHLH5_42170 [Pseudomonas sp. Cab53]
MNKPLKTITNPMTLIAVFATLSETSAAISLPFLDDDDREYYLWFLISFPFYLLLLFFTTLNFNYRSLYSPSDFPKGKHFLKTLDDSLGRRKRTLRRTNKHQVLPTQCHRPGRKRRRPGCVVCGQSQRPRSKRDRQATRIIVYVIYRGAGEATARQDG